MLRLRLTRWVYSLRYDRGNVFDEYVAYLFGETFSDDIIQSRFPEFILQFIFDIIIKGLLYNNEYGLY